MAPQVQLSPATFGRLQKCAEPLVDDIESVINKLIDSFEKGQGVLPPLGSGAKDYGGSAPSLTHTKVLSVEIGGKVLQKSIATWNGLLNEAVIQAAAKLGSTEALKDVLVVPYVVGAKEDTGYRYLPAAGVSVQGQDANSAWKGAAHIANALHIPVRVFFIWYQNDKAANPGQTGKLRLNSE